MSGLRKNGFNFTRHATSRCQQRGIRRDAVDFVLKHFDLDHHAGAGVDAISISKHRLEILRQDSSSTDLLDRAARTVLLVADNGDVVTAINRPTWYDRFHRGAERLHPRRHSISRLRPARRFR